MRNLSHFLQIWAFPPGLILLLIVLGALVSKWFRNVGKAIIIFAVFLLWVFSTPVIAQWMIDQLQNQYPPLAFTISEKQNFANANQATIVVLGSGVDHAQEYENKTALSGLSLSRVFYAAYLHNKLHAPIIVSGGNRNNQALTEATMMQNVLQFQFAINVLAKEDISRNTADESRLLLPIFKQNGIRTVYLISNAWHMPRSMYAFNQMNKDRSIEYVAAPMGYIQLYSRDYKANYLPSLRALNTSVYALHEYVGLLWYRMTL